MVTGPDTPDAIPGDITGLPMQPTGSGVADLEVAFERMRLAEEGGALDVSSRDGDTPPAGEESEAHPS